MQHAPALLLQGAAAFCADCSRLVWEGRLKLLWCEPKVATEAKAAAVPSVPPCPSDGAPCKWPAAVVECL